jgi:hypothetical protein
MLSAAHLVSLRQSNKVLHALCAGAYYASKVRITPLEFWLCLARVRKYSVKAFCIMALGQKPRQGVLFSFTGMETKSLERKKSLREAEKTHQIIEVLNS